jgi:hypothetical protein
MLNCIKLSGNGFNPAVVAVAKAVYADSRAYVEITLIVLVERHTALAAF